jgi:hypothetical protein
MNAKNVLELITAFSDYEFEGKICLTYICGKRQKLMRQKFNEA